MNYNNAPETYMRSVAKIGIRQQTRSRDLFDLSDWLVLWKPVGKILMIILPIVLIVNIFVASAVTNVNSSIVNVENKRHELMDKNIELLARKAWLWSPSHMEQLASEKLALHGNSSGQVGRFDSRSGTFIFN